MNHAPEKLQPAIYGGVFMGVLSALPLVSVGNCCCLWVLGGGVLAAYLLQQNHPYALTAADGALVGLLAGLIGGVIYVVLSIPIEMAMGPFMQQIMERVLSSNPDFPPETRQMIEGMANRGVTAVGIVLRLLFGVCVGAIFGMLGGLLGIAIFKKKELPPPPGTTEILPPA